MDWSDKIPGGVADDRHPADFDIGQLLIGLGIELEHTDDVMVAVEIVMDHLAEDPCYYDKLMKVEDDMSENKKALFEIFGVRCEAHQGALGDDPTKSYKPPHPDAWRNSMKGQDQRKRMAAASKRRAAKMGPEPQQMDLPGMGKVFGRKQPPKPGSAGWQKQADGRKPLDQVKGKYLHVTQNLPLSPSVLQQTGHTYETLPSDMLKGTSVKDTPGASWGSASYKINDDGSLELASANWDSSD